MKILHFTLVTTSILICACSTMAAPPGKCTGYAASLAAEDATRRAERVKRSGAPYFLGVRGFTLSFPGVDDPTAVSRIGYKILEGTSDAIDGESCWAYQRQATSYAERFNRRILKLMAEK